MTDDERLEIVRAITIAGMWGHGGVSNIVLEELDKTLPCPVSWRTLSRQNEKRFRRERIGVLNDEKTLSYRLSRGGWLTNWDEDGCSLFNPPPMNGLDIYVSRELTDKYKQGLIPAYVAPPTMSYEEAFGFTKSE